MLTISRDHLFAPRASSGISQVLPGKTKSSGFVLTSQKLNHMPVNSNKKTRVIPASPDDELEVKLATGASEGKLADLPTTVVMDSPGASSSSSSLQVEPLAPDTFPGDTTHATDLVALEARIDGKFEAMMQGIMVLVNQDAQEKMQATLEQQLSVTTALMQEQTTNGCKFGIGKTMLAIHDAIAIMRRAGIDQETVAKVIATFVKGYEAKGPDAAASTLPRHLPTFPGTVALVQDVLQNVPDLRPQPPSNRSKRPSTGPLGPLRPAPALRPCAHCGRKGTECVAPCTHSALFGQDMSRLLVTCYTRNSAPLRPPPPLSERPHITYNN